VVFLVIVVVVIVAVVVVAAAVFVTEYYSYLDRTSLILENRRRLM
jgi:ABC-type phosphate transport system permease subunit